MNAKYLKLVCDNPKFVIIIVKYIIYSKYFIEYKKKIEKKSVCTAYLNIINNYSVLVISIRSNRKQKLKMEELRKQEQLKITLVRERETLSKSSAEYRDIYNRIGTIDRRIKKLKVVLGLFDEEKKQKVIETRILVEERYGVY